MRRRYVLRPARNRRRRKSSVPSLGRGLWRALKLGISAAVALVAVGGAVMGVYFGWEALERSERLRIRHLNVVGVERTLRAELLACAQVRVGDPILGVDLDAVALRLRRHPWVQVATVRRRLPDTLTLEVQEQRPAVLVSLGDLYVANAQGRLFKRLRATDRVSLPVLTGLDAEAAATQAESVARRIQDGAELLERMAASAPVLGRVEELHWDEDLGWSAQLGGSGSADSALRVHLGTSPNQALRLAERALLALQSVGGRRAEVLWADAITEGKGQRVHVRLADGQGVSGASTRQRPAQQSSVPEAGESTSSTEAAEAGRALAYLERR